MSVPTTTAMQRRASGQEVRVGCTLPDNQGATPLLTPINKDQPLSEIIAKFCKHFGKDPTEYALRSEESREFITEENRAETLRDGVVLQLSMTPVKLADNLRKGVTSRVSAERTEALKKIKLETIDRTLSAHFVALGGMETLLDYCTRVNPMEAGQAAGEPGVSASGVGSTPLSYALHSINNILSHGLVPISKLEGNAAFIDLINARCKTEDILQDKKIVLRQALLVAAHFVRYSSLGLDRITSIKLEHILSYLRCTGGDEPTQECVLTFLNEMIRATREPAAREKLFMDLERGSLFHALPQPESTARSFTPKFRHQLHLLQQQWLNWLNERSNTPLSQALNKTEGFSKLESLVASKQPALADSKLNKLQKFQQLGFENPQHPDAEFEEPPGVLVLDCLAYICDDEVFAEVVLEQDSRPEGYRCSFIKLAKAVVLLLLRIFKADAQPEEEGGDYKQLLFSAGKKPAFSEIFKVVLKLASRTLKEMEAKPSDFDKVIEMVGMQVNQAIESDGGNGKGGGTSLEEFEKLTKEASYSAMVQDEEKKLERVQTRQLESEPARNLREKLRARMGELVKESHMARMVAGSQFYTWSKNKLKKDSKYRVWLSANRKLLFWVEQSEANKETPQQCEVSGLACLLIGMENESIKKMKKTDDVLAKTTFGLMGSGIDETLELTAVQADEAPVWIDGIRSLMGQEMKEKTTTKAIDDLLDLEMRLSLVGLQGIPLPEKAPRVPELPDTFDFAYAQPEDGTEA